MENALLLGQNEALFGGSPTATIVLVAVAAGMLLIVVGTHVASVYARKRYEATAHYVPCPRCRRSIPPESERCPACGRPFAPRPPQSDAK